MSDQKKPSHKSFADYLSGRKLKVVVGTGKPGVLEHFCFWFPQHRPPYGLCPYILDWLESQGFEVKTLGDIEGINPRSIDFAVFTQEVVARLGDLFICFYHVEHEVTYQRTSCWDSTHGWVEVSILSVDSSWWHSGHLPY